VGCLESTPIFKSNKSEENVTKEKSNNKIGPKTIPILLNAQAIKEQKKKNIQKKR
jgi:hypothetical protein